MNDQRRGAERLRSRTCQLCGAVLASMLLLGTSAQAQQSSGFGGSFEPPQTPSAGQDVSQPGQGGGIPPGGGGDGFGGGVAGSDGFGGGSFVTGGSGGGDAGAVPEAGGSGAGGPGSEGFGGGSFETGGDGASPQPEAGGGGAGGPGSEGFGGGSFVTGGDGGSGSVTEADGSGETESGQMSQLAAFELQDFGISPSQTLYEGPSHGPTPTHIPGGQVITTEQLVGLMQRQQIVLIDVLGGNMTVPGALSAAGLGAAGSFNDQIQTVMVQGLQRLTGGNRDVPVVFFCLSPHCWMSYNAALRAIAAGYTNVLWYRGGVEAWAMAGLDLVPAHGS